MARPAHDLSGQRFGKLVVVERLFERKGYLSSVWVCTCDCGKEARVFMTNLKRGFTTSCGCAQKEAVTKHGLSSTPEHRVWRGIKERCYNPKNERYSDYGQRGITMSDEWRDNFEAFYRDMGPRPSPDHSIDRIENDKGYYKGNCRWATDEVQARNKRNNVLIEYNGTTKTLSEWCRELGLSRPAVNGRMLRGMTFEEAIRKLPI